MKTLADFKRRLEAATNNPNELVSTIVKRKSGEVLRQTEATQVGHVQGNSFTLMRNGQKSWADFGKASLWSFTAHTATQTGITGATITFEFINKA